jgi:hypothetical protein
MIRPGALSVCLVFAAFLTGSALAAETTREEYKAAVEPICRTNKQASDRYLKGIRRLVREDKLKEAAVRFDRAAAALQKAHSQLATVPQPVADEAKLGKWLAGIEGQVSLMKGIAATLRKGETGKASSLSVKLTNRASSANNLVIPFDFRYCRIDPSQYT